MIYNLKLLFFYFSKYVGLFLLSKKLYSRRIRILCYHGFTIEDEHHFAPGLFIDPKIFDQRMTYLKENGFQVITLDQAYLATSAGDLPKNAVVLTIDDGFYSVMTEAGPILKKNDFPSTLYLTSYYFTKNSPIFNLAVRYMFWKTAHKTANFSQLGIPSLKDKTNVTLGSSEAVECLDLIKDFGHRMDHPDKRIHLLQKLGQLLGQSYEKLQESKILSLINGTDLKKCQEMNIDIQLHTHRHHFPLDSQVCTYEIDKNQEKLAPYLSQAMDHFCYPSGQWSKDHWPVLKARGIKTATTCENGLISADTPVYAWNRILDSARVSQIEFEAEMSGFNELIRKFLKPKNGK